MSYLLIAMFVLWVGVREINKRLPFWLEKLERKPLVLDDSNRIIFCPPPPTLAELNEAVDLTVYLRDPDQKD